LSPVREYRWKYPDAANLTPEIRQAADLLAKRLSISPVLAGILVGRSIDSYEKARSYFRPGLEDLHDPSGIDQMDAAVDRILKALNGHEHIVIFGDYDVDGTNGAAMLFRFFRDLGVEADYHIPHRIKDGYGISAAGIERVAVLKARLLITVDCGITAVEQVKLAKSLGIDVVICDHHEPGPEIPDAIAVLDALKPSCSYPFKSLCGCGVAYKLIQALASTEYVKRKFGSALTKHLLDYLQYVALATTADIVPLTGENRVMVKLGLELINTAPLPGIRAIVDSSGLTPGKINSGQLVFVIAPRINAVGRLGDANRAVDMLAGDSYDSALQIAKIMENENSERRKIDEETFIAAQEMVDMRPESRKKNAIVLHRDDWHPGVIGIVASRLVEKYYLPAIMLTTVDGVAKGSARSIMGFNIHDALKRCEDKLIQFGGHKYAAGLTVEIGKLDEFRETFERISAEILSEDILTPEIRIDAELQFPEITSKFVRVLNRFAPFGPENMRPVFARYTGSRESSGKTT
jgi:single-stranded-DNA-specific exonuclease